MLFFFFSKNLSFPRLVSADSFLLSIMKQAMLQIVILISGVCTVCFWRGVWYLWDVYLWPDEPVKSAWFTFGLGKSISQVVFTTHTRNLQEGNVYFSIVCQSVRRGGVLIPQCFASLCIIPCGHRLPQVPSHLPLGRTS